MVPDRHNYHPHYRPSVGAQEEVAGDLQVEENKAGNDRGHFGDLEHWM